MPSLEDVWYRGHYLHDGSVASLEEMFDAERLKDPCAWRVDAAQQLLAFLRTS